MEYPSPKEIKKIYGDGGVHKMTSMEEYVMVATTTDTLHFAMSNNVISGNKGPTVVTPGGYKQVCRP